MHQCSSQLLRKIHQLWCILHIIENIGGKLLPKRGKHRYQAIRSKEDTEERSGEFRHQSEGRMKRSCMKVCFFW